VAAVAGALDAGATTVGTRLELDHLAPSPVRAELAIEAVLQRVAGRRLQFAVRLHDGHRPMVNGHITRVVVDAAGFLWTRRRITCCHGNPVRAPQQVRR
jgi:fluoroacetyl-CoA thioesterase